ncbi:MULTISPECIES: hypothetical protein [unclassified Sedimentibacter]|uniref:hypothetical protein n=1 Tax=unclassified Sedimentibacter TaxID=2649220 RepID=UPI0027DF4A07|nr:hypothetical protein [Sedimentibacter sp. MB35-C1]WMJ77549.1 hypothetical protein RBQ61_01060 [Sedimentibacter sp. MB35-C1]
MHKLSEMAGRGCQLKDVVIDSTGCIVGISINRLYFRLKKLVLLKGIGIVK